MPLLELGQQIMNLPPPSEPRGNVLVLETQGFRYGIRVDRVATDHEVFVREIPQVLSGLTPLAGVAILTDGEPIFLIEAGVLVGDFV